MSLNKAIAVTKYCYSSCGSLFGNLGKSPCTFSSAIEGKIREVKPLLGVRIGRLVLANRTLWGKLNWLLQLRNEAKI